MKTDGTAATFGAQGTRASETVWRSVFASQTVRSAGAYAALAAVVVAALATGVFVGGSPLAPAAVVAALLHPRTGGDVATIVWSLRLPRVVIGACVGTALAVSGMLLQGLLRNPLVDPFLTGVSAGSAAAVAVAVAFGVAAPLVPGLGFAAGLATALLVAFLARRGSGVDAERLILAGVSLSALFSAIVTLALLRLGRSSSDEVLAWLAGSLAGRGWTELAATLPYGLTGLALAALAVPALSAMRLGPSVARAVGVDLARTQWLVLGAATLLAASAVTLSGVVGFVGLIVPHLARRIVGTDARRVIVASALLGAALVPLADALARSLAAPTEIPLGVLLAFVGVPTFLYLYLRPSNATRLWGT
jgi:iron complex transport system permease protein